MPRLDGTGPEGRGRGTGRQLGDCAEHTKEELLEKLGKGEGKRRRSGGGEGDKKRLKSSDKLK